MRLYFVELSVRDWDASVAWYRGTLGLRLIMTAGSFALFDAGGGRIALKAGRPAPGGVLLALEVDDLAGWGGTLGPCVQGPIKASEEGFCARARLLDPDGYEIDLFEWTQQVSG